jgi:hypothetical protein
MMKVKELSPSQDEVRDHLRAKVREQELEIQRLRESLGGQREMHDLIKASLKAAAATPLRRVTVSKGVSEKSVPAVFVDSDWHTGEVIKAEETEAFGSYDYDTEKRRLGQLADKEVNWAVKQRNAYNIEDAAVFALGDWVSGGIHYELETTNEFPVPVQAVKAGFLMGERLRTLAAYFNRLTVYEVAGDNHGRLTRKPQAKQKGFNNWTFVVYAVANLYCANVKNLEVVQHQGMKDLATVAGKNFLLEHGDTIKSHMGIPLYGILRSRWREATRRMNTDRQFHYYVLGHFHVPYEMEDCIIGNGSLSGTSEFDHSCGRHALPSQTAFLVHPEHGIFNRTAFRLS